jgi:hypothetical protein
MGGFFRNNVKILAPFYYNNRSAAKSYIFSEKIEIEKFMEWSSSSRYISYLSVYC